MRRIGLFFVLVIIPLLLGRHMNGGFTGRLDYPTVYSGDLLAQTAVIKAMIEGDWFPFFGIHSDRFASPYGYNSGDFPTPEQAQYLLMKLISLFPVDLHTNPYWVMNIYFLLSFPAAALLFYWVARKLRVDSFFAASFAVIFSCLPYHVHRFNHFLLAIYSVIPLIWLLVLHQVEALRTRTLPLWLQIGMAALLGAWHAYYAFFFLCMLSFASTFYLLKEGQVRPFLRSCILIFTTALFVILCTLPNLFYQFRNGKNPAVAQRPIREALVWALRPVHLFVPTIKHRIPWVREISKKIREKEGLSVEGELEYLGFPAGLGIAASIFYFFSRRKEYPELNQLGLINTFILLLGLTGGISLFFNLWVTPQFRSYNRISIVLACGGMLSASFILSQKVQRPRSKFILAFVVCVAGVVDQSSGFDRHRPTYQKFLSDQAFFSQVEQIAKGPRAVLQLPYSPYPEHPRIEEMPPYEHMRGYLQSQHLRWSYGTMKGRPESATIEALSQSPLALEKIKEAGYSLIYIDRRGYADHGKTIEADLKKQIHSPPILSQDGHYAVYLLDEFNLPQSESAI